MKRGFTFLAALAVAFTASNGADAKAVFQTIEGPQGGRVLMAPLDAAGEQAALIALLRDIHQYFGAKPEIGQIVRDKSGSLSALFSDKTEGKEVQGIAIVSAGAAGASQGTVVYDVAARFGTTANTLLKIAGAHAQAAAPSGQAAGESDPAAPLTQTTFPDGSGSIGLPQGWKIIAARAGGAAIKGPKNEAVILGNYFPIIDTSTPQGSRQAQMYMMSGRGLPGKYTAVPYTTDAAEAYKAVATQYAQKLGKPAPFIQIKSQKSGAARDGSGGVIAVLTGVLDFHDGEGRKNFNMQVAISPRMPAGWSIMLSGVQVPVAIGTRERNTLNAMVASYRANNSVINGETQQAIGQIHAIGDAARAQANAAHAAEDAQEQSFNQHMSDIDRQSAGFSDYLLDQSVVTNENGEHKRFYNDYANALVQSNPQKFSIVPTSQYIQGQDF